MSKAFTKEESEVPVVVVARAPLPEGAVNYVTPRGLELLRKESRALAQERAELEASVEGGERARALSLLNRRRAELDDRLASAVLVSPAQGSGDEVRFGAAVTVRGEDSRERTYRLVGVDEADPGQGRIAFVSPLSRALLGRRVGDTAIVRTPRGDDELEVLAVEYDRPEE